MILAIETATDVCGVALIHREKVVGHRSVAEKNVHAEKLLPMVEEVLRDASLSVKNVDAVAVSIGPGSFTGLRIGLSTAKGLAIALRIPIVAVSTLDALAYELYRSDEKGTAVIACPLIDAKRDEAFFCFYGVEAGGVSRRSAYDIAPVSSIVEAASQYPSVTFVGDGVKKLETLHGMKDSILCKPAIVCNPVSVGIVAEKIGKRLSVEDFLTLEPLYIREFVTTQPGRAQAASRKPGSTQQEIRPRRTSSPFRRNSFEKG
jgi:tRNA threonylcarbamoyladenosine biosynthesis protein TsaB